MTPSRGCGGRSDDTRGLSAVNAASATGRQPGDRAPQVTRVTVNQTHRVARSGRERFATSTPVAKESFPESSTFRMEINSPVDRVGHR